jgi:hypothetical protein
MTTEFKYKNKEIVTFDNGIIKGTAHVVGACNTGNPIIGITYMVEVITSNTPIPCDIYPYSIISMFECHIRSGQ